MPRRTQPPDQAQLRLQRPQPALKVPDDPPTSQSHVAIEPNSANRVQQGLLRGFTRANSQLQQARPRTTRLRHPWSQVFGRQVCEI